MNALKVGTTFTKEAGMDDGEEEYSALLEQIAEAQSVLKENQAYLFHPYPYQETLYKAAKDHNFRFACLGNQCGKTFSAGMEMSFHLTGLYPTMETHGWDWEGIVFTKPILAWAIGIKIESTRKILQKELLGTERGKDYNGYGVGSIPKSCIDIQSVHRDGDRVISISIAHHNKYGEKDGYSTLEFRATAQGQHTLMGARVDYIWCDEEDPFNADEIFAQCVIRTTNTDGHILITATPENGYSTLIQQFEENDELFIMNGGWDDAPHITPAKRKTLLAGIPEWQRDMRTKGIPSRGAGQVFQFLDENIVVDRVIPKPHWPVIVGVDFGKTVDPSTIVFITHNVDDDLYIIYDEIYLDNDRSPKAIALAIQHCITPNIPVIVPADGNSRMDDGITTKAQIMKEHGCNVMNGTFSNPTDVQNEMGTLTSSYSSIEAGLAWICHLFSEDKLFISENCNNWFREKRSYQYKYSNGKFTPVDRNNHVLDASRYGLLSIDRYGIPFGQCMTSFTDFNNGFDSEPLVMGGAQYK